MAAWNPLSKVSHPSTTSSPPETRNWMIRFARPKLEPVRCHIRIDICHTSHVFVPIRTTVSDRSAFCANAPTANSYRDKHLLPRGAHVVSAPQRGRTLRARRVKATPRACFVHPPLDLKVFQQHTRAHPTHQPTQPYQNPKPNHCDIGPLI